jgi:hypothetical protein
VPLDILNVVQSRSKGVVDINDKDFPVGFSLIEKSHDTENLDLLDLTGVTDGFSNLANVEGVVVTVGASLGVLDGRVFPGLREGSIVPDVSWGLAEFTEANANDIPWWGKQFRTNRSLPFLISTGQLGGKKARSADIPCLMGLKASSLEISSLALVHRGTSTITIYVNSQSRPDNISTYC